MTFVRCASDALFLAAIACLLPLAAIAQQADPTAPGSHPSGPRNTMLPLVQPLWSELSAQQRQVLEPFASQWNAWPSAEKRSWVTLANRVPKMKPDDEARTQQRIKEWAALTPEQRRVARQNYRLARQLPPDERKAQWERYTQLTPEQRAVLRTSGWTSNTAALHAGAPTGLAKDAAQPFVARPLRTRNPQ